MTTWLRRWFTLFLLVLPFVPVVADADDTEVKRFGPAKTQERGISGKWAGTGVNDSGAQSAVSLEITEHEDGTLTGKGHGSPGKELKILNGERVTADVYHWEHATETQRWRVRCTVKGKSLVLDYTCTWKEDGRVKGGYGTVVLTRSAPIAYVPDLAAKKELANWQGTWRGTNVLVSIDGDKWTWADLQEKPLVGGTIRILGVDEKIIKADLIHETGDLTRPLTLAIFRVEGDTLFYAGDYDSRPTAARFERNGWQRVKKQVLNPALEKLQVLCYDLHSEMVTGVAFSPDGRRVISASRDGTVRLIEASTGKLIHCLAHPSARSVAISPDGKKAISTGDEGNQTLRLWDLEAGKELQRFAAYQSTVIGAAFSPDGKQVLFGAYLDKTLRLLDIESGQEARRFEGHTGGVHGIALSADGKKSLSGSFDTTVRLWDNATCKQLKRFDGHQGQVLAVALSKDGKRAVSGDDEHVIKLWDLETGKEIRQMEAHAKVVHALAFSSDGHRIASANHSGHTVSLWDAETGKELHRFEGHTDYVYDVAFSPDGRFLVSGGRDKTVRVWRVPK